MSLLEDLRAAVPELDGQFQPASNELAGLLGAVIQFLEHGKKFLEAAGEGRDEVVELIAGKQDDDAEGSPEQRDKAASKASKRATAHQTKGDD